MTAAAALALARAHGVSISLDGSDLILESRGAIPDEVRLALKSAKADLVAALRHAATVGNSTVEKRVGKDGQARKAPSAKPERALSSDDLLDALRRKGFVISLTGSDRDLREVVEKRQAFFRRLLLWKAPGQSAPDRPFGFPRHP